MRSWFPLQHGEGDGKGNDILSLNHPLSLTTGFKIEVGPQPSLALLMKMDLNLERNAVDLVLKEEQASGHMTAKLCS